MTPPHGQGLLQVVVDAVLPPVAALLLLGWAVPPHGRGFEILNESK